MLDPILQRFEDFGIVERVDGYIFEKRMSLTEGEVRQWLKESASHALRVNYFQNIWTMGPLTGALYGLAKVRRAKSKN